MKNIKKMTSSLEDYLETISILSSNVGHAHSNDIADTLGVKKSSVTVALRNLEKQGLIEYEPYQPVCLTSKGTEYAEKIKEKHKVLAFFLKEILKIDDLKKIDDVACKIEHALDDEVLQKFINLANTYGYKD
ncbi:MAG: metal-dependent transcriptional regulator [Kiritimatiellae bacterium]|jgi:DtxR family Mn-dependent transcriptional regulator|nr:metal-dependent transcriptional regulator [Kiritimatiellia bacterium]